MVLNLPPGVVSTGGPAGFGTARLLQLDGVADQTVSCPAGTGTITCVTPQGIAPGGQATFRFQLRATDSAVPGRITGIISAGASISVDISVEVNVPPVNDDIDLTVKTWQNVWWHRPARRRRGAEQRPARGHVEAGRVVVGRPRDLRAVPRVHVGRQDDAPLRHRPRQGRPVPDVPLGVRASRRQHHRHGHAGQRDEVRDRAGQGLAGPAGRGTAEPTDVHDDASSDDHHQTQPTKPTRPTEPTQPGTPSETTKPTGTTEPSTPDVPPTTEPTTPSLPPTTPPTTTPPTREEPCEPVGLLPGLIGGLLGQPSCEPPRS